MSRRLVVIMGSVMLLEGTLYSVLTPLLPRLARSMELSTAMVGVLFSSYLVGGVIGAIGGVVLVNKCGIRVTLAGGIFVMGLSTLGLISTEALGWSVATRTLNGISGGLSWVAAMAWLVACSEDSQRGTLVGSAMGIGVFGTLMGPLLGNAASLLGFVPTFGGVAVICFVLTFLVLREPSPPGRSDSQSTNSGLARQPWGSLAASIWVLGISAATFGALYVLLPLRLSSLGVGELWIGWIFVACSAMSALTNRLAGSWIDRDGPRRLSTASIVSGSIVLIVFAFGPGAAVVVVTQIVGLGLVFAAGMTPHAAALTFAGDRVRISDAATSMLVLVVFSGGESIGGIAVPLLADVTSPAFAFLGVALITLLTLLVVPIAMKTAVGVPPSKDVVTGPLP
jgi:MFS family permease